MRRGFTVIVALASLVFLALPAQATAAVDIQDYAFSPTPVTIQQGGDIQWHNVTGATEHPHTSTSDLAGLWMTGTLDPGDTSSPVTIEAAGTYPYHCSIHPFMHGKVRVPILVAPTSGNISTIFTITLAAAQQSGYTFDVEKKVGADPWKVWQTGVQTLSLTFHHGAAGTWKFRSRLHKTLNGAVSSWSPAKMITIS